MFFPLVFSFLTACVWILVTVAISPCSGLLLYLLQWSDFPFSQDSIIKISHTSIHWFIFVSIFSDLLLFISWFVTIHCKQCLHIQINRFPPHFFLCLSWSFLLSFPPSCISPLISLQLFCRELTEVPPPIHKTSSCPWAQPWDIWWCINCTSLGVVLGDAMTHGVSPWRHHFPCFLSDGIKFYLLPVSSA